MNPPMTSFRHIIITIEQKEKPYPKAAIGELCRHLDH
jgi:hypothetical protein